MSYQEGSEIQPLVTSRPNIRPESKSLTSKAVMVLALIALLLVIAIVAAPSYVYDGTLSTNCVVHWGFEYCPGMCLVQEGGEEYCPDGPEERPFFLYNLTQNTELARCNDGTIPRVHFREGLPGPHENEWLFRFEGGNACYDQDSCEIRLTDDEEYVFLTAASARVMYNDYIGGMLNGSPEKNPEWYDYNTVDLHYCSSDSWAGNASADSNTLSWEGWTDVPGSDHGETGWYFRGYENMMGAIMTAHTDFGMDETATRVIISGFSAGCVGMLSSSELIKEWFDEHLPQAELFFLCDSGWFLSSFPTNFDTQDCSGGALECPLSEQMVMGWELWNPIVPQTCLDAGIFGGDCLMPEYHHEYITTREQTFIQENTYDIMQTELHVVGTWSAGLAENVTDEYRIALAQAVVDSLQEKAYSYTSSNCDNHDSTNRNWMYEITWEDPNTGQQEFLSHYFKEFMDKGTQWDIVDDIVDEDGNICEKCNPTCPDVAKTPHYHGYPDGRFLDEL